MKSEDNVGSSNTIENSTKLRRRKVLAGGAMLLGAERLGTMAPSTGAVSASETHQDPDEVVKKAFQIERIEGKEAMESYVQNKGWDVTNQDKEYPMDVGHNEDEKRPDESVSSSKIDDLRKKGVKARLTGLKSPYESWYYVSVRINLWFHHSSIPQWTCVEYSTGEAPVDLASLGWNTPRTQYWELRSTDRISDFAVTASNYSGMPGGDEWSHDAVGFKYDDKAAYSDWVDENTGWLGSCADEKEYYNLGRVGVKLRPVGAHDPADRAVYASYEHTWSKSTANLGVGFGVSAAGPVVSASLSPESEVKSITTTTKTDRDTVLKISQDEMSEESP